MNPEDQQYLNDLDKRLWTAADKLRANVNPIDYMHVVLGLVFLKYVPDAFKEHHDELKAVFADPDNDYYLGDDADDLIEQELEAHDYYTEKNVLWVKIVSAPVLSARFEEVAAPLMQKIKTNNYQTRTLAAMRDALLPKLLSGELRVPIADAAMETVA